MAEALIRSARWIETQILVGEAAYTGSGWRMLWDAMPCRYQSQRTRGGALWIRFVWQCRQWQHWGSISDPGGFGNGALGEGDVDRIDIDGGGMDQIGDEEEVVRSGGIGAEKASDRDGSDNDVTDF
jgi:hypothetical protein